MDASGHISSERALDTHGNVLEQGPEYHRSALMSCLLVQPTLKEKITWVTEVQAHSGYLIFDQNSEDQVVRTCRTHGALFQAHTLEKVNNDTEGDSFTPLEDFYPVLHNMLLNKQDWKYPPRFRGMASFELGTMEWTDYIIRNFGGILEKAEILGAVGVSCFPYHCSTNTWKAFCELWGPLTNTLHHGNGEMSISLYDLKVIGGLPILGRPYEEVIPVNKELECIERYPPTVAELLNIHSQLCTFSKRDFIFWDEWADHFYRGKILYAAYGEIGNKKTYLKHSRFSKQQLDLQVSKEGHLAAFLAYWLSRFVLPSGDSNLRPSTFYMASLMAHGIEVSLAPSVLGCIYHGLTLTVTDPEGPGSSRACLPIHYVIGWLGEHFPCLYRSRTDSDFPSTYPNLARYAGIEAMDLDISSARRVFRTDISVVYRPCPFVEQNGCFLTDDSTSLSRDQFELLVCMRSSLLPMRVGRDLYLEPYYPNRFARQFGFDQGVPSNNLSFGLARRRQCCIEDLAKSQLTLLRTDTGARFYIPRSTYNGTCTWTYCRWWMRACAPYLGRSVSIVYLTLTKRRLEKKDNVFVIKSIREFSSNLRKEVPFLEENRGQSSAHKPTGYNKHPSPNRRWNKSSEYLKRPSNNFEGRHIKRLRNDHHDKRTRSPSKPWSQYDSYGGQMVDDSIPPVNTDGNIAPNDSDQVVVRRLSSVISQVSRSNPAAPEPQAAYFVPESVDRFDIEPAPQVKELEQESNKTSFNRLDMAHELRTPIELEPAAMEPLMTLRPEAENCGTGPQTSRHNSVGSKSGSTEPLNFDEDDNEDICSLTGTASILQEIFGLCSNKRAVDFIITEVQVILDKLTSSRSPQAILKCQGEISESIDLITTMLEKLGPGRDNFELFSAKVAQAFDMASQLSQDMEIIETGSTLNIEYIRKLIQSHEECKAVKKSLDLELSSLHQDLKDLTSTEKHIIEAEKKAQKLRESFETAKSHLVKKIDQSKASFQQQNKLDEELQHARAEINEAKLAEFDKIKSTFSRRQEELEQLLDSLSTFGKQPE